MSGGNVSDPTSSESLHHLNPRLTWTKPNQSHIISLWLVSFYQSSSSWLTVLFNSTLGRERMFTPQQSEQLETFYKIMITVRWVSLVCYRWFLDLPKCGFCTILHQSTSVHERGFDHYCTKQADRVNVGRLLSSFKTSSLSLSFVKNTLTIQLLEINPWVWHFVSWWPIAHFKYSTIIYFFKF